MVAEKIQVLLVEDNLGDRRLAMEALKDSKLTVNMHTAANGVEALSFLYHENEYADTPRPDLILLDLNLPKKDGREVLAEIKANDDLKSIPVVILSSSEADTDIAHCYNHHANSYIPKPVDLEQFTNIMRTIESFWFTTVKLPQEG